VVMRMAASRCRSRASRCRRSCRSRSSRCSLRRDVEQRPRLHQPVRQGRARDRRRHGQLHLVHAARRAAHQPAHARGDLRAVPVFRACACCATGAASST
jgi:hypothetical protein